MKYYLVVDNCMQLITRLVSMKDSKSRWDDVKVDEIVEFIDVDTNIIGTFMHSIFSREAHFTNRYLRDNYYYGWTISRGEFDRIKRLTELYPMYLEYHKLINL